uniref:ABC transmembrane type-2 domain-containing protein n=1 Tax=Wrangelia sp. TaxID=2575620 RepID=A0A4D6X2M7_9FLOR|nr:hypothetical protein [Wrangelia sp.]
MYKRNFVQSYFIQPNIKINKYSSSLDNEIYALIKRLYYQTHRRPSTFLVGIIQPLIWLILFSGLFQNIPINLLKNDINYNQFLNPGIIIFTSFTGSINAGLPIMFDREFGFLNRILISPLTNRNSILFSSIINIWTITLLQVIIILIFSTFMYKNSSLIYHICPIIYITSLIILHIASISIYFSFILPGHIEFLAFVLLMNLPILFSSTALAPLSFMPYWLQIMACLNPLTYAIEILRYILLQNSYEYNYYLINTIWLQINITESIYLLNIINISIIMIVQNLLRAKYK